MQFVRHKRKGKKEKSAKLPIYKEEKISTLGSQPLLDMPAVERSNYYATGTQLPKKMKSSFSGENTGITQNKNF